MSELPDHQVSLEVLKKFRLILGSIKKHFRDVEEICGISSSQVWILKIVEQYPLIGINQISEKMSIHQTTASLLVEKLSKKNFVEKTKDSKDLRKVGLKITNQGKQILSQAPMHSEGLLPYALSQIEISELIILNKQLDKVIQYFDNDINKLSHTPLSEM